jgi:hypothetical protein
MTRRGCEKVSTFWPRTLGWEATTYTGCPRRESMRREEEGIGQAVLRTLLSIAMVGLFKNVWTASDVA